MKAVDDIWLDKFLQLKMKIKRSKEHMFVGIDLTKKKHDAFFRTVLEIEF